MGSTFDFSPLFRSTVGFDRLMSLLESAAGVDETAPGYPPYNIEKLDANDYRVTMAVAGFGAGDLHIETRENTLVVTGKIEGGEIAGIGPGPGGRLLHIDLVREVPEEMRPRRIEISTRAPETVLSKAKKLVEGKKKAA